MDGGRAGIRWIAMGGVIWGLAGAAEDGGMRAMNEEEAAGYVRMALAGIDREYPNKPGEVLRGREDVKSPREMHPVFFGHFDWHSSVHGHWMLVRLLKRFPRAEFAAEVRRRLGGRLTAGGLKAEASYFQVKENRSFERMYGWAWLLRLAAELREWDDEDGREWARRLKPLEQVIVALAKDHLPKLDWPVRCGFHPESSFPLAQMLDYARVAGDPEFEELLAGRARHFYAGDRDYPAAYEPSGNDFFSPGLNEADLMRRVMAGEEFAAWLEGFLPGLAQGEAGNLLTPVEVSDPEDGHLIHLAGLNLNRAWTMLGIASALPADDARREALEEAAAAHGAAGLAQVHTGHYGGEHWLASFAVYLQSRAGP